MIAVRVQQLPHAVGLPLPEQASSAAAGLDLRAAVTEPLVIPAGQWVPIPTGLCLELPEGTEGQVRPRSGLAARHGVTVLNSPGTVDADYRGEVMVLLINHGPEPFVVNRGDRIAQLVIAPVPQVRLAPVADLADSDRGAGGFGSTGVA
ncbi:MAG: dUTP diphosphatase [Alphaproteobacteria bacterium]